ncbi:MAG: formyltransferase family protein [Patescibacteria group bacterium]
MNVKPKLIIFASGTATGGGSGFENLVVATKSGVLDAEIVAVVSNHDHGGVRERAERLGVPFTYFAGPYDAEHYQKIVTDMRAEWIALSGWLKFVKGLDPRRTFNIHPALLSQLSGRFGGEGMWGHRVHEAVKIALDSGEITESGLTMHFVTDEYDRGPVFFEHRVPLQKSMSSEDIAKAVNKAEHDWQPKITNLVVHGEIRWNGINPETLVVPGSYSYLPPR